jgi:SAM-dependent methyltransferase
LFAVSDNNTKKDDLHPWDPKRGSDYKTFWNSLASTPEGAVIGVLGEYLKEDEIAEQARMGVEFIHSTLSLDGTQEVLEVGCGIGRIARGLSPYMRRYVGVDIAENMVSEARKRSSRYANLEYEALQQSDLSIFPDASFDRVVFEIVLIHLAREDAYRYLLEAHRVLRPGGLAYCQFYNLLHPDGWDFFARNVKHGEIMGGAQLVSRPRFYTAPEVRMVVEKAGFQIDEQRSALELVEQNLPVPEALEILAVGVKK